MKIHEFQARELLAQYNIPISGGGIASDLSQAESVFAKYAHPTAIAKVQVLMGGRGKAGGVRRISSGTEAREFVAKFLGKPFSTTQSAGESKTVRSILFTEDKKILEEYYLGAAIDRSARNIALLFSKFGGMDIEEIAGKDPNAILKIHFIPEKLPSREEILIQIKKQITVDRVANAIADIGLNVCRLFIEKDASICEINPLALVDGLDVLALDAKIVFDDNAAFRHSELASLRDPEEEDEREHMAKQFGLSYVSMDGDVGCLVNGAGLAMATMDMIKLAGGEPANFLDVGGSATVDTVREGFKIILQDERVDAILVNIFGGIMKCDVIAEGVIQASKEINLRVPLVVRLEGTNVEKGREMLNRSGLKITSCHTIEEAAHAAVKEAKIYRANHVNSR